MGSMIENPDSQLNDMEQALIHVNAEAHKLAKGDSDARDRLVAHARELIAAVETPMDSLLWAIWAQVRRFAGKEPIDEMKCD